MQGRQATPWIRAAALAAAGWIMFTANAHAEFLHVGVRTEMNDGTNRDKKSTIVHVPTQAATVTAEVEDEGPFLEKMKNRWQAMREQWRRTVLEAALTMFFIRSSPPPPPPPKKNTPNIPPPTGQGGTPTTPPPPPPPPTGSGEPPPVDPPPDPPTQTPEPTSLMLAFLGAGLMSLGRRLFAPPLAAG